MMSTLKTLSIATALILGAASLAIAQDGPATGGNEPVAGGAGNGPTTGTKNGSTAVAKTTAHKSTNDKMSKPQ